MLEPDDIIQPGDEGLNSLHGTWHAYTGEMIGKPALLPNLSRRKITPQFQATPGDEVEWVDNGKPIQLAREPDMVNSPPHYRQGSIETIDAIKAALTPEEFRGYVKGNAMKYVWRERNKGGDQDLEKAAWYLNRLKKEKP